MGKLKKIVESVRRFYMNTNEVWLLDNPTTRVFFCFKHKKDAQSFFNRFDFYTMCYDDETWDDVTAMSKRDTQLNAYQITNKNVYAANKLINGYSKKAKQILNELIEAEEYEYKSRG